MGENACEHLKQYTEAVSKIFNAAQSLFLYTHPSCSSEPGSAQPLQLTGVSSYPETRLLHTCNWHLLTMTVYILLAARGSVIWEHRCFSPGIMSTLLPAADVAIQGNHSWKSKKRCGLSCKDNNVETKAGRQVLCKKRNEEEKSLCLLRLSRPLPLSQYLGFLGIVRLQVGWKAAFRY